MQRDDYLVQYWEKIEDGSIVVCDKIRKQMQMLIDDLEKSKLAKYRYEFDIDYANDAIEFVEAFCKHSKGKWTGKPVELELWQKAFLQAAYGFIDKETGLRKYTDLLLVVARKNGKTTLAAGIALYEFLAAGEGGARVHCVANKLDQAKLLFSEAVNMVNQSTTLSKRVKKTRTTLETTLASKLFAEFSPLSADSTTLDGLNPSAAVYDEIHAAKTDELAAVIKQGMSAREQPLMFKITTSGFIRNGLFDSEYEEATNKLNGIAEAENLLCFIYEQDSKEEIEDRTTWIKSNPNLNVSKTYDYLLGQIDEAKRKPTLWSTVYTKDFNIAQNTAEGWLSTEFLKFKDTYDIEELRDNYALGGVDLSNTMDLTCASLLIINDKGRYLIQQYFMPEDAVEPKQALDKVPYKTWIEQGWIRTTPGKNVDLNYITMWYREMYDNYQIIPFKIGYDSWGSTYWVKDMQQHGLNNLKTVIQGPKTFSPAMNFVESELYDNGINYNNNPVLRWCLTNAAIKLDEGNNKGVDKKKSFGRIDGTVSLLDSVVVYLDNKQEYENLQGL